MKYNELGIRSLQQGEYEKAIEAFVKAAEQEPDNPIGYINLGNVFTAVGDVERAERFFQKALTLDEEAVAAYYGLANLYYNNGRFDEAAKLYEKAVRNGMEQADAYFMLGKSLERDGNDKLALPYLQRGLELDPADLEIKLSYGILLAKLELFTEAEKVLRELVEQDPDHPDAHYNLGMVYAVSTDRKEDALLHLERAFTIEPDHVQSRYIYDMIKKGDESK
ncbi:lipopolysaccharide assembly protein LapB [Sporosarcina sp. Te-1]|uniref:tetratricopeptide repeat protein n=1 Tax=Sporosarcina sp. Te-1 TaxID=2818390 RepID=UPI001A9CD7BC|nr:tetratricopeptide repeat protein [Sporosarcina sp. Te-1]QTD41619.1 tetratricopeptide repeat protein [Sporosarcina sp. Te-1]